MIKYFKVEQDGDRVIIPLYICNDEDTPVTGVTVTFDAFPTGITFDSFIKDKGTYTALTRVWAIGVMAAKECAHGYLYVDADDITALPADITATIVNAEDGEIPGENETALIYNINIHDTSEVVNYYDQTNMSFVGATRDIVPNDRGTLFVSDTTAGNAIYTLPPLDDVQSGEVYKFLHEIAGGNTLTIKGNDAEEISADGASANTYLMAEGEYLELVSVSTNPQRWLKISNNL